MCATRIQIVFWWSSTQYNTLALIAHLCCGTDALWRTYLEDSGLHAFHEKGKKQNGHFCSFFGPLLRSSDVTEFSLVFKESQHASDKRKKNQYGHFETSKGVVR